MRPEQAFFAMMWGAALGLQPARQVMGPLAAASRARAMQYYARKSVDDLMPNMTSSAHTMPQLSSEQRLALTAKEGGSRNVCIGSRIVPELFVIGGIKAATTTLCSDLRGSPAIEWPLSKAHYLTDPVHRAAWKEGHFFDSRSGAVTVEDVMNNYSPCRRDVRMVGAEGSARYSSDPHVPGHIARFYGPQGGALKFVLLVREPLARMQSHFYHSKRDNWCQLHKVMNFQGFVRMVAAGFHQPFVATSPLGTGCGDVVQGSLYAEQLQNWFAVFKPSQFTIVPFLFVAAPGQGGRTSKRVAEYVWDLLGVKGALPPSVTHANKIDHANLHYDLDDRSIKGIRAFFDARTGPLKLAGMLKDSGAKLYEYGGPPGDEGSIAKWLADNW